MNLFLLRQDNKGSPYKLPMTRQVLGPIGNVDLSGRNLFYVVSQERSPRSEKNTSLAPVATS